MVLHTIITAVKFLFKKPYTRMVPWQEKPFKTEHMRGRHVLDMSRCTGCSMCQQVCPANAIDMVVVEGDWKQNPRKRFPRIDLHKCTFCGLCVEYCPFKALSMTDATGFELYTRDKSKTLAYPQQLSVKPENNRFTIRKEDFFQQIPFMGRERVFKACEVAKELIQVG